MWCHDGTRANLALYSALAKLLPQLFVVSLNDQSSLYRRDQGVKLISDVRLPSQYFGGRAS